MQQGAGPGPGIQVQVINTCGFGSQKRLGVEQKVTFSNNQPFSFTYVVEFDILSSTIEYVLGVLENGKVTSW